METNNFEVGFSYTPKQNECSVSSCLASFFSKEVLTGDNKYFFLLFFLSFFFFSKIFELDFYVRIVHQVEKEFIVMQLHNMEYFKNQKF